MDFSKMIMIFFVVVVGAFIAAMVDGALGLNQTFADIGSVKAIIHKTVYMLQGGAMMAVIMWKK